MLEPAVYTKNIILEEVRLQDFMDAKNYWCSSSYRTRPDFLLARVINPLSWPVFRERPKTDSYRELLEFLLEHPWLDQICVREHGGWTKQYARRMTSEKLKRLAVIAADNPANRNYFDVKFKDPADREYVFRARMEFREHENAILGQRIVGHNITVPYEYTSLFTLAVQREEYSRIEGLWY